LLLLLYFFFFFVYNIFIYKKKKKKSHFQTLYPWIEDLKKNLEVQGLVSAIKEVEKQSSFDIEFTNDNNTDLTVDPSIRNNKTNEIYEVVKNDRATPDDYFRDTRLIDLKTTNSLR